MHWVLRIAATSTLILILVLCLPGQAAAAPYQQSGIAFGEVIEGTISAENYRQQYAFDGRAGQVATVIMRRVSGDLDPYLLLVSQRGIVVAFSDDEVEDGTATRNAALRSIVLPEDGVYTIIATRFGQEHGTTTGDYTLSLDALGTAIAPIDDDSLLRYGDEVVGTINDEQPYVVYRLEARRGDVINISLARVGGNLDPQLDFFDPVGQFLINGDDDSTTGTLNARITNFTIPQDGLYFVQATRYGGERGTTSGLFTLAVNVIPVEQLGTRPSNARFLPVGTTATAAITADTLTRFFRFDANRGDIVTVTVERLEGDLLPRVSLVRSDLSPLGNSTNLTDETPSTAQIPGVSLTANGTYLLIVSRAGGVEGDTLGSFSIQVNTRAGMTAAEGVLEIVYGGQITGSITDGNFADRYLFMGAAGDRVTIQMQRTEGNLDPLLTLLDASDKQLFADDDGFAEGSQDAQIQAFELPADGLYFIEASRFQRSAGTTTGIYTLRLLRENTEN